MDKLFTLIDLQKLSRKTNTPEQLAYFAANNTYKLIPYDMAVFWSSELLGVKLKTVSGNGMLDDKSPYANWLSGFIKQQIKKHGKLKEIKAQEGNISIPDAIPIIVETQDKLDKEQLQQYSRGSCAIVLMRDRKGKVTSGLWMERKEKFHGAEIKLLEELGESYGYHLGMLQERSGFNPFGLLKRSRNRAFNTAITFGLIAIMFFPVRLSITASAEVVSKNPTVISAPFDGIIDSIEVDPGQAVEENEVLFFMDKTSLEAEKNIAEQALRVAENSLSRVRRESLIEPEKKNDLKMLQEDIKSKSIEYNFAKTLLQKSDVIAPIQGIAMFPDKTSFEGVPVTTGEKIMILADPSDNEILIRVPINAMLPIDSEVEGKFFLNTKPLSGLNFEVKTIGYQASQDADGLLTYKVRGKISGDSNDLRVGWNGTAKLYSGRAVLAYAILRRPLITVRKFLGF